MRPIRTPATLALLLAISPACGDSGSSAGDSGSSGTGGSSDGSGDSSGTGAESSTTGVDDWPLDHGYVKFEFHPPADAPDAAVLDGTDTVVISADYGPCLTAYYEANPDVQQAGALGPGIFGDSSLGGEGWEELLCSPIFGDHAGCEIVWITQRFDVVQSLTVTYQITADLATRPLFFGPLPTAATAACEGDTLPTIVVPDAMSIRGIDPGGSDLWEAETFVPAEAASRQEAPIVVTVLPVEI